MKISSALRLRPARARLGPARLGPARLGPARLGPARLGPARLGLARLGLARLGLAALAVAGLALTLAACGGGDDDDANGSNGPSSPEEAAYLEALAPALQAVNAQLEGLDELRAEAFDGGADAEGAAAYGSALTTYNSDRLAAIEALTPGESLQDQHADIVFAARDNVALAEEIDAALAASPPASQTEFLDLYGELDGVAINSRFRDACTALQSRATSGGLAADLQCLR